MRIIRPLLAATLLLAARPAWAGAAKDEAAAFLASPYLQIGHAPARDALVLLWHAPNVDVDWGVEYQSGADGAWTKAEWYHRMVDLPGVAPHRVYRAELKSLAPGKAFGYRVKRAGEVVFKAVGRAPRGVDQPYRMVIFGDCGAGTPEQKPIAYQAYQAHPDLFVIPGDMVYDRGRVAEYREQFWPVYNADEASPSRGAPLLRSTLTVTAPGNHDTDLRDPENMGGNLAYFYYWEQPLNGPRGQEGGPFVQSLGATPEAFRAGLDLAAGDAYPRMANYSFDYGNAHWTIVDSNPYVDWTDRELRDWVAKDLAAARRATWRFVAFHHPGFNSAREHFEQQQMRLLAPILEAGKVDIVFAGHVHNYQRSYPMRFAPDKGSALLVGADRKTPRGRVVNGHWALDKAFDGRTDTTPQGVIYLVTGAGGQHLYNPEQQDDRDSWQGFTDKFVSKVHSLTVADVDGKTITVRQVSPTGEELDRFVVTK